MFDPKNTYWRGNGLYQAQNAQMEALMPPIGKADTVEGELVRASAKIYHDLYNNGFGNNWSGAWNFLDQFVSELHIRNELDYIAEYRCGLCHGHDNVVYEQVERIVNAVYEYVLSKAGEYTPNDVDMWSLDEPDDFGYNDDFDRDDPDYDEEDEDNS